MSGVYTQTPYRVSLQRYLVHLEFPKDAGFNKIIQSCWINILIMIDVRNFYFECKDKRRRGLSSRMPKFNTGLADLLTQLHCNDVKLPFKVNRLFGQQIGETSKRFLAELILLPLLLSIRTRKKRSNTASNLRVLPDFFMLKTSVHPT